MEALKTGENPLGYEKPSVILRKYSIPGVVANLVSSLYNMVDQIFIGQGIGLLGVGATNVAFPLTTICLSLSLLIGIGCSSSFSIALGNGDKKRAEHAVENAVWMSALAGFILLGAIELFLVPMLTAFGATQDILPYAVVYVRIVAKIGRPHV